MIRTKKAVHIFNWAVEIGTKKKKMDCSSADFFTIEEGLCVQIMHLGCYDTEPEKWKTVIRHPIKKCQESITCFLY